MTNYHDNPKHQTRADMALRVALDLIYAHEWPDDIPHELRQALYDNARPALDALKEDMQGIAQRLPAVYDAFDMVDADNGLGECIKLAHVLHVAGYKA